MPVHKPTSIKKSQLLEKEREGAKKRMKIVIPFLRPRKAVPHLLTSSARETGTAFLCGSLAYMFLSRCNGMFSGLSLIICKMGLGLSVLARVEGRVLTLRQ